LKKGDAIFFTTAQGVAEYRVTKRQIVKPDAMWITRPTKASTITLFACHPPHSIAYRWVVFAKLHSMTPHKAVKLSQ
jgi:sortase A